jgi:hypothetical protein
MVSPSAYRCRSEFRHRQVNRPALKNYILPSQAITLPYVYAKDVATELSIGSLATMSVPLPSE